MSAPVIFYMFLNMFSTVVINDNFLTTLVFDEPVGRFHTGVASSELYISKSADSKMIFIRAKGKKLVTNLNVPTRGGKLYTFLIRTGLKPHSIIQVKDGKKSKLYKEVRKTSSYLIEDSEYTTRFFNKLNRAVSVNTIDLKAKSSYTFSKGSPLFLGEERIYK